MKPKRTYLVTGGFGFLGSALTRALVQAGHFVRVLDNGSRGAGDALEDVQGSLEILEGDIREAETVARAIRGVDAVCHLAFVNGTRYFYEKPALVLEVGVKGMMNVLDGCIRAKVGELVLASSSEVYQNPPKIPTDETAPLIVPDPHNPRYSYAGGKIISELLGLHYGREYFNRVVIFRPHNVFGPRMGWDHVIPEFITRMIRLKTAAGGSEIPFPIQGSGEQTRAFIYIDDFTDGLMRVIERGEHLNIYHIGTNEERSIREVALRIADSLGIRIQVVPGPEALGGTPRRCPDIRKLQALGFQPHISFEEGLWRTVQWYGAQAAIGAGVAR